MEIAIIVLVCIVIILQIVNLAKNRGNNSLSNKDLDDIKKVVSESLKDSLERFNDKLDNQSKLLESNNKLLFEKLEIRFSSMENNMNLLIKSFDEIKTIMNSKLEELLKTNGEFFAKLIKDSNEENEKIKEKLSLEIKEFTKTVNETLSKFNETLNNQLKEIREDNNKKLDKINETVNEKLEKTLEGRLKQSFDSVIEHIGGVNKAIGEIKGLANDVGSLKTVLTNVKTKGIVGEVILGNIISDILTVGQYDENVKTKKNSTEPVEFAIKLPNTDDGFIYLPIDSKLPLNSYQKIKEGMDTGNIELINTGRKDLRSAIRKYAKDIVDKYVEVPNTTEFAIMFLPIEGLYIETLNLGLFEEIQKEFKITLAGPTTLTAILNALQMGFKTLAIQKKSADVFKLLGAVKTEFEKFAKTLEKTQKKVDEASDELDSLVGTRTRKIQIKLRGIETLDYDTTKEILEIEDNENEEN